MPPPTAVRLTLSSLLVLAALTACLGDPTEPDPELTRAEELIKEARLGTDGPALLAFLKSRTVTEETRARLALRVKELGDESYEVRERASESLIAAGRIALPRLRAALNDPDPEIVRRAGECLERIESAAETALREAVVRVLVLRRPAGLTEALLAFAPSVQDVEVADAVAAGLTDLGRRDGRNLTAITAAAASKDSGCRALVGEALAGSPESRAVARKLLRDPDEQVRFRTGVGLARAGEKDAVPILIALLAESPVERAYRSEELLQRLAGERTPAAILGAGSPEERRRCRTAWEAWWMEHAAQADLARLRGAERLRGITLICEYDGPTGKGRVWARGPSGKVLWEFSQARAHGCPTVAGRPRAGSRVRWRPGQ